MAYDNGDVLLEDVHKFTCCVEPDPLFLGSFANTAGICNLSTLFRGCVVDEVVVSWCWLAGLDVRLIILAGFQVGGRRGSLLGGV